MTATALRATSLPMPAAVFGDVVSCGTAEYRTTVREVTIATTPLYVGGDDRVYRACGRCSDLQGRIAAYGHVYAGLCFECAGAGVLRFADSLVEAQRKVRSVQAADLRAAAKWEAERPTREAAAAAHAAAEYDRAWDAAHAEQARRVERDLVLAAKRYAGTVGDKVTVEGIVATSIVVEGYYGSSVLVVVEGTGADEGVTVKTVGTSEWHYGTERGDEVRFVATVKAHEEYRGVRQTVVVRPKAAK